MDIGNLLKMGASMIQNNSDESTTNISSDLISSALGSLLGSNGSSEGGLDLGSIVSNLSSGDLGSIVASWIGSGENQPIDADKITDLLGSEKVEEFAQNLGVSTESAKNALAEVVPNLVDQATNEESSLATELLEKVGGIDGAMNMLGKMFKS